MAKSKKSTSKKPVAKKEVILETKEVKKDKKVLQAKSTHVEVPYVPRKIDTLPPPKEKQNGKIICKNWILDTKNLV